MEEGETGDEIRFQSEKEHYEVNRVIRMKAVGGLNKCDFTFHEILGLVLGALFSRCF